MSKEFLLVLAIICFLTGFNTIKKQRQAIETLQANIKAYQTELDDSSERILQYYITAKQLRHQKDSISQILMKAVDQLKIKDNKIKSLQYNKSIISVTDTIVLNDTVFCQQDKLAIDTAVCTPWYCFDMKASYPGNIKLSFNAVSEKSVITHVKRETVNPPKKFFLFRWFQKKHNVVTVDIVENNPYIENIENRFITIAE